MEIKYAESKGKLYIYLSGELDEYTARFVKAEIENAVAASENIKCVIFNFSKTTFMDSTGIGVLLGRYKKLQGKSVPAFIAKPEKSVDKVLTLSGIYKLMPKL